MWFTLDIGSFWVLRGLASSFVQQCQKSLSVIVFIVSVLLCRTLVPPTLVSSCLSICSLHSQRTSSHAPQWSHMDSTISVWQLCGHHIVCNYSFTALSKTLQLPLLAHRCRGRFHCACAVRMPHPHSQHHLSTTYITSRFSCASCYRSDLKFDPRLSFHPFPALGTILGQPPPSYPLPAYTPIVLVLSQFPSRAQSTAAHTTEHRSVG